MHQISAPELSTVDLIDELEARIAAIRKRNSYAPAVLSPVVAGSDLRTAMERAEVSEVELARAMDVPPSDLSAWIAGVADAPQWALAATKLVALLPPSERRKLIAKPRADVRGRNRTHPFSRIEDL
jgi:hypothetical protein